MHVPTGVALGQNLLAPLVSDLPLEQRPGMERFIAGVFQVTPACRDCAVCEACRVSLSEVYMRVTGQPAAKDQHLREPLVADLSLNQQSGMEGFIAGVFHATQ